MLNAASPGVPIGVEVQLLLTGPLLDAAVGVDQPGVRPNMTETYPEPGGQSSEKWSRPVDRLFSCRLLITFLLILVVGSFDELAVDEGGTGADQGDQLGCVYTAPAGLG